MASRKKEYSRLIGIASKRYGIAPHVLAGLIEVESGWDPTAESSAGAGGLTQFIRSTAKSYGVRFGASHGAVASQILGAAKYLKDLGYAKDRRLALAKYNAGPANPGAAGDYPEKVLGAARGYYKEGYGKAGGSAGGGGRSSGGGPVTVTEPTSSRGITEPGGTGLVDVLRSLREREQQAAIPSQGIEPPSFAAQAALPKGYQSVESGPPAPEKTPLSELLSQVQGLQGQDVQHTTVTGGSVSGGGSGGGGARSGGSAGGKSVKGAGGFPTAKRGKIIGTPYAGTHTLGNWQSDRAVDIGVPVGTPVLATSDGRVKKTGGQGGTSGRFAGYNITTRGNKGDEYFFAHLSKVKVKPGQRVRKGQVIGYSGSANGVAHLHFGRMKGRVKGAYY